MEPSRSQWDVVVVGGGPAGAAVAARLAGRGHRVLVIDRDRFPRPKPCGECLNPAAVAALDRLGVLPELEAAHPAPLAGWEIHSPKGSWFRGGFPPGRQGLAIPRATLDAILLDHARAWGVALRVGVKVVDLVREGGVVAGVRVSSGGRMEDVAARLVIGADGLRSVVVRRLDLIRRTPRLRKVALTAHVRGVEGLDGRGELHVQPWGCVGVAAVGDGLANVVVVVEGEDIGAVSGSRDNFFDRAVAGTSRLQGSERVDEVLATGPFDWPVRPAVTDGALLVGDAAGYYDPFTGQGIYRALHGAELAAAVADAALLAGDVSRVALAAYERARRRAFGPGVRLQHLVEAVVSRPGLLDVAVRRLRRRPALADALIAATGDLRPVGSLFRPHLLAQLFL